MARSVSPSNNSVSFHMSLPKTTDCIQCYFINLYPAGKCLYLFYFFNLSECYSSGKRHFLFSNARKVKKQTLKRRIRLKWKLYTLISISYLRFYFRDSEIIATSMLSYYSSKGIKKNSFNISLGFLKQTFFGNT